MDEMLGPLRMVFAELQDKIREASEERPLWDVIMGFVHAINWRESWLVALVSFEATMLLLSVLTRKRSGFQGFLFFLAMAVVYCAERLNKLGHQHWERFATQPYFDEHGAFFTALVSAPLLACMFIILINYLIACSSLLIEAKRKELKLKYRQQKKTEAAAASGAATASGSTAQAGDSKKAQ
ncbi:MAG: hypothetical protein WDW38_002049 [Sanguina aurantia]